MSHNDLISALTNPDLEVRQAAFEEILLEMDDDLALAIAGVAAGNQPDDVRADAIVALGPLVEECSIEYEDGLESDPETGPPISEQTFRKVVERLRRLYNDDTQPKVVRRRALEVLVRDPQPWQEDEIRKHLASADEEWRLTAIFGMGSLPGFEKDVLDAVETRKGVELTEAVCAAARLDLKKAAPIIRKLAASEDTERDLRIESILALPHVDVDAFDILEELKDSSDRDIAEAAQEALEELLMCQELEDEDLGGDGD